MMTRRRKERGGMCVCVVMQRDWETRDMEKRDNEHNDEAGWIFLSLFFGGHSRTRDSHYHYSTHNKQHLTINTTTCIPTIYLLIPAIFELLENI